MKNEIPLPYYLQQHEISRNKCTYFTQIINSRITPDDNKSIPYNWIIILTKKKHFIFTWTDPENSVEGYLTAVTANLILNICPKPKITPLYQN